LTKIKRCFDFLDFTPTPTGAIGGELIPLDNTSLLVAGSQLTAAWLIPVVVTALGIAIFIARKL